MLLRSRTSTRRYLGILYMLLRSKTSTGRAGPREICYNLGVRAEMMMMMVYYCPSKGSPLPVIHKLSPRCSELSTSIAAWAAAKLRLATIIYY